MANLPKKGLHPLVAVAANFCCLGLAGYVLLGQTRKGLFVCLVAIVPLLAGAFLGALLWMISGFLASLPWLVAIAWGAFFGLLAMVDVYQVAEAVEKDQAVDENGYKLDVLYKIMVKVDKSAILQA